MTLELVLILRRHFGSNLSSFILITNSEISMFVLSSFLHHLMMLPQVHRLYSMEYEDGWEGGVTCVKEFY